MACRSSKRSRRRSELQPGPNNKRLRTTNAQERAPHLQSLAGAPEAVAPPSPPTTTTVDHPVLSQLYPSVQRLRDYVLAKLLQSSRIRRKKVTAVGKRASSKGKPGKPVSEVEAALAELLDSTLVGHAGYGTSEDGPGGCYNGRDGRWDQWVGFSQRADESAVTLSDGVGASTYSQSEIVDFAIWSLFEKTKKANGWPKHMLCDGYRRNWGSGPQRQPVGAGREIPGILSMSPNPYVQMLKQSPWPDLLLLLGKSGERIMIDLLLDCAIFKLIKAGEQNFCQISGKPLSEVGQGRPASTKKPGQPSPVINQPTDIVFARYRMMYARAALNARGRVHFGLRHIRKAMLLLACSDCADIRTRRTEQIASAMQRKRRCP
ncbi:uncharacterized protein B0I36DRAFT_317563 [Microdochium trichocladiopsis]|uniref:Telomerase reverse transcriptase n=1 Tax=Microdochium trichocladiopsis TaxID=1682393 RepID=A0A9P8YBN2_9PEZI|nr:uncharacterized protein B0I36DRAFT_317563 [Microdochium trichocladiopsis]KAH7035079.1 hypothetical protein B0I36DRAFT_317563 [Microdochium trichocladiopsis]